MQDVRIDIRLRHDKPVELSEMANALSAINKLAVERISKEHGITNSKVMLQGVKEGCDIYQLSFVFNHLLPVMENFNTFATFTDYIKKFVTLDTKTIEQIKEDESITPAGADLVKSIITPIEKNSNYSSLSIELHANDNSTVNIFEVSSKDAAKVIENTKMAKQIKQELYQEEVLHEFSKVLIEFYTTTNSEKKVRDKAYCDDILPKKAVATIIENKNDKKEILEEPYKNYFLVDISVQRIDGVPKLYTVTKLHEIIPKDDDEE